MTTAIPEGLEGLIPHLVCDPCGRAIEFYRSAFGAEEMSRVTHPDTGKVMHAALRIGDRVLFVNDDFPEFCMDGQPRSPKSLGGTPVTIHRYVADCDAAVQRAVDAGAELKIPPADMFWGDRYGMVIDPFGHNWSLATHIRDVSDREMSEVVADMAPPEGR